MAVYVDFDHMGAKIPGGKTPSDFQEGSSRCITIGLINNMGDEALKTTERQYLSLLGGASDGMHIRLSFYTLPEVPRQGPARRHLQSFYASVEDLWDSHLDGLIVTGREPLARDLREEPYWENFSKVISWAQENTHSTVWSCLAAHAAILHLDGIGRVRRNDKLFGIFECARAADHPLMAGTPSRFRLPHSRWNGVSEDELTRCGYRILTRAADADVDTFIKQQKSVFVFFQGHPEYEADTLLHEYRRDIGRYFKSEMESYPALPQGYFDLTAAEALTALRERAVGNRSKALLPEISAALGTQTIANTWQASAIGIYKNWLEYLCTQKEKTLRSKGIRAFAGGPRLPLAGTGLKPSDRGIS